MDIEVRVLYMANEVIPSIWKRHGLGELKLKQREEPMFCPQDPNELPVEDLEKAVWVRMFVTLVKWRDYMKTHYRRMVASFELFAQYSVHACEVAMRAEDDPYDRFLAVFALLTYFAIYVTKRDKKYRNYVQIVPEILSKFYVRQLSAGFATKGYWRDFPEHLKKSRYLLKYEAVERYLADNKNTSYSVCQEILKESTNPKIGSRMLRDITPFEVEDHYDSYYYSDDFEYYENLPNWATETKKGIMYAPLPDINDDGPPDEVVEHYFGKQYTFVGDNLVYVGLTARDAIMQKAKECLALIYDEIDFTNFIIDMALQDLDAKVEEMKKTTRSL